MVTVKEIPPETCTNYSLLPNEKLLSIIFTSVSQTTVELVGILTIPQHATRKFALILHGKGGHKNYLYQALVAKELCELGIHSFRFDFRDCGDSYTHNQTENTGRRVVNDIEDIDVSLDVFSNGSKYECIGVDLMNHAIIAHSRGAVSMFQWAMKQQELLNEKKTYRIVPNLINCAGRFTSKDLIKDLAGDFYINCYSRGSYVKQLVPKEEIKDLSSQDFSKLGELNQEFQVLSVYGINDHIVPVQDAAHYSNILQGRHWLELISGADHNFIGLIEINDDNSKILNLENLPIKNKRINYNHKVVSIIIEHLKKDSHRYYNYSKSIKYQPRWKNIDGISNFRDLGGWKTNDNNYVRTGFIYRCANPSKVTELGKQQLIQLNIKSFFDFRSFGEFEKNGGLTVPNIDVNNVPVYKSTDLSPQAIALRYGNLLSNWSNFKFVYRDMLHDGPKAFKTVFQHILDHPNDPIVFNCQAGKDRTGVMAMLILLVCGVDNHTIAKDYELTTQGLIPDHDEIRKQFDYMIGGFIDKSTQIDSKETSTTEIGVSTSRAKLVAKHLEGKLENLSNEEMFKNLISSKYETMISTIEMFNNEFGGIDNYMINNIGFTKNEINKIRNILLIDEQHDIWNHRNSRLK